MRLIWFNLQMILQCWQIRLPKVRAAPSQQRPLAALAWADQSADNTMGRTKQVSSRWDQSWPSFNNTPPIFNSRNVSTMVSPVPGPLFYFVPPAFFLQRESLRSEVAPLCLRLYSSQLFVLSTGLTALSGKVKSSPVRQAPLWCFDPFGGRLSEPVGIQQPDAAVFCCFEVLMQIWHQR